MESRSGGAPATSVVVHCRNLLLGRDPGVQWLIGSPFLPPFTVLSTFRCLHYRDGDSSALDFAKEADDLRVILLRGFDIIGAVHVGNANSENNAAKAAEAARKLRKVLFDDESNGDFIGATADLTTGDIMFYITSPGKPMKMEAVSDVKYENDSGKLIWELGCLLRCELLIKLPVYIPLEKRSDANLIFSSAFDAVADKLRDPSSTYIVERVNLSTKSELQPIIIRSSELDFFKKKLELKLQMSEGESPGSETTPCAYFYPKSISTSSPLMENADPIRVTAFINHSKVVSEAAAPVAHYFPASEPASLNVVNLKLDVLCFSAKELPVATALSVLVIPGLIDQIYALKSIIAPNLLAGHPQLRPYHFFPAGILHPVTTIYELSYGETEKKLADTRRSLHLRLGLPLDRPLLRIANALSFKSPKMNETSTLLPKDVHSGIPESGVAGGLPSLVQGSYEYYHYLQDGFDDNGWGCAYRSLQTIISWFRLQQYTSIQVPSHREIQQALVEIGDKEPSFIASREWIGAIELSFVLDKLLGVSCKVINVRSGSELPEKCRELALHFETQGTPIMIGGGVLAYTLLGVDFNDASGDCSFLILDPHYTGTDDLKKILGGGWCGWKKAVDSKGKSFFLHDKFYNLLLPQRPNMV